MTNSVVISKIDAVMHVVLSKAKKKKKTHMPYGELIGIAQSVKF